jgi:predicted nucleic acid-binding protein
VTEVVLDASVIVKWAFPDRAREAHAERALNLLHAVHAGRLSVVEPPHWLAEVAAVVTRLAPDRAPDVVALMHAMGSRSWTSWKSAWGHPFIRRVGQHVFDTLYHTVALRRQAASLVTADERYYQNAALEANAPQDFVVPTA